MGEFSEKEFLRNYRLKPNLAFRQLMDEYRDKMYLFCRRATRQKMDAEDLAQEVFVRVWKGLRKFRGDSSLTTWMYRIAWNVCASHLDKQGRTLDMSEYSETDSDDGDEVGMVHVGEDDAEVVQFEKKQYLEVLFNNLPSAHRLVLTLYYLEEQSYDEITAITGMPMGTVKATLHRAKANLRKAALEETGKVA